MPNPVVSNNSQHYTNFLESTKAERFVYYGPAIVNTGPGGTPTPICANIAKWYTSQSSFTPYNLVRKTGYKHVPYSALTDNHHPLAYELLKWTWICPVLSHTGLTIKHRHTGFPNDCPASQLGPFVMSSGSNPAWGSYAMSDQSLENEAVADLNDSISDQRDITVNWAMSIAERRETVSTIGNRLLQLTNVVRSLRRGRFEKAYEHLFGKKPKQKFSGRRSKDRAANLWLEWTYGWSPLLSDIHGAVNDLVKTPRPLILRCKGGAARSNSYVNHVQSAFGGNDLTPLISYPVSVKSSVRLNYVSYYRVDNRKFASATAAGLTDPALLAWELIPFSFVFDWFVNVGDVLKDITIANGLTHLSTVRSEKRHTLARAHAPVKIDYTKSTSFNASGAGVVDFYDERTEFIRTVSPTRPRIYLGVNTQPFSVRRIISAAALLNNLGKGLSTKYK